MTTAEKRETNIGTRNERVTEDGYTYCWISGVQIADSFFNACGHGDFESEAAGVAFRGVGCGICLRDGAKGWIVIDHLYGDIPTEEPYYTRDQALAIAEEHTIDSIEMAFMLEW